MQQLESKTRIRLWTKLPFKFSCALGEEIVLAIHVDHTVFQDAFPFIFHTGNLVVRAKHNIALTRSALVSIFLVAGIRIVQITINSLRVTGLC